MWFDSAGTMTAMAVGVKSHIGAIGVSAGAHRSRLAAELPAHAVDDLARAERARVQPGAVALDAVLVAHDDADRGRDEQALGERLDELVGELPHGEGHLVDAVERRLELEHPLEVGRGSARHDRGRVGGARERVPVSAR